MSNFIEELRWRGMINDIMPGTEEQLNKEMTTGYVGIDPTGDSLHIGHLVPVMMLKRLQLAGHKPIALIGGATGMIGDPSGKSEERNLLDEEELRHNQECIKKQLFNFLDFDTEQDTSIKTQVSRQKLNNGAILVNNYDWTKDFSFLGFMREVGKHITVNYMIAKDSVKKRLETGLSFTEFSYQLLQAYDFYYLFKNHGCKLQMGGSDQWGNIVTGTELIRRKAGEEAFGLTCPLITKADGGKFGKTEKGNVWLDPKRTSSYSFYQFWLNSSDEDAEKYIKIFTFYRKEEVESIIEEHKKAPEQRLLQKALAKDITIRIHSETDFNAAVEASQILFGKGTTETLKKLTEDMFLSVFEGVPQYEINKDDLSKGIGVLEFVTEKTNIFTSKSEARRTVKENALSINKQVVNSPETIVNSQYLLNDKYILVQRGKKNYFIVKTI